MPPPPSKHAMPWVVQLVSISKCGGKVMQLVSISNREHREHEHEHVLALLSTNLPSCHPTQPQDP